MVDNSHQPYSAKIRCQIANRYILSNIILHFPIFIKLNRDQLLNYHWLAVMGMLDTLQLMGIDAEIWNEYEE